MSEQQYVSELGISVVDGVPTARLWSRTADSVTLVLFDDAGTAPAEEVPLQRQGDVWQISDARLTPGRRYGYRVSGPHGPRNHFDPSRILLDPYGRGVRYVTIDGAERPVSEVVDTSFDWAGVTKPQVDLDRTVIYEAHVKGLTKLSPYVPEALRGTYAGIAHESTVAYLKNLGVTAIQLLPVHQFDTEGWLKAEGRTNYWGYNSLSFFAVHPSYASPEAQIAGPSAVLREFKGMVRLLHEAGIEVFLDVVYNHTSEGGPGGDTTSLRGIDNSIYYRQTDDGVYIDTTGVGNTTNTSNEAVQDLIIDSLRYFAGECQIDGFRFDLAAALGRGEDHAYSASHPLLNEIVTDPELQHVKLIAEPWDTGMGGWQTGNFPLGWSEWNDRYRDRMRDFWLQDIAAARFTGNAASGIGRFATRFAGSSNTYSEVRGPLASVNFITAHDGFTMYDLTAYNVKHNLLNGENNRDGSTNNNSYNFGYEGETENDSIQRVRRQIIRNLLGTLLLSAGIPMINAGDEFGRTQHGNNNPYNHDDELTWVSWARSEWHENLLAHTRRLTAVRAENAALRPSKFASADQRVAGSSDMQWFDALGGSMDVDEWNSPQNRTLQYFSRERRVDPNQPEPNQILLVVHAIEDDTLVTLARKDGIELYELLWDSSDEIPLHTADQKEQFFRPGQTIRVPGISMQLYRVAQVSDVPEEVAPETESAATPNTEPGQ